MDSLHFTNTRVIKYYKHTQHTVTDLQTVIFLEFLSLALHWNTQCPHMT